MMNGAFFEDAACKPSLDSLSASCLQPGPLHVPGKRLSSTPVIPLHGYRSPGGVQNVETDTAIVHRPTQAWNYATTTDHSGLDPTHSQFKQNLCRDPGLSSAYYPAADISRERKSIDIWHGGHPTYNIPNSMHGHSATSAATTDAWNSFSGQGWCNYPCPARLPPHMDSQHRPYLPGDDRQAGFEACRTASSSLYDATGTLSLKIVHTFFS